MSPNRSRRRPLAFLLLASAVLPALSARRVEASNWMFRRSYFSHPVPPEMALKYPIPVSLSAYRPAIVSPYPGFAIQSVQRINNVAIPNGASFDYTLMRSSTVRQLP